MERDDEEEQPTRERDDDDEEQPTGERERG